MSWNTESGAWEPRKHPRISGAALVLVAGLLRGAEAASPVTAELMIPPAEAHVIGDATPLYWRFFNHSTEPLAFMWEGCCRLNGRLTVTSAAGEPVELIPPGQALAHMFAKAERLEPGAVAEYDTRVSDWVQLSASGTYRLQGRYTGVLADQFPQVPKDLQLWRDATTTPPIHFSVLSVDDYLAGRVERENRRGVALELTGQTTVLPPEPLRVTLRLRNLSDQPLTWTWPDDLQFWVVDPDGRRVRNVPTLFDGPFAEVTLPGGTDWERALDLDPIRFFEGVPFGDYRMFVDLAPAGPDRCRVPSNSRPLTWRLDPETVASLVGEAARGSRLGFRNAPLKLLRVYLAEVGPQLREAAERLGDPAARELARELWLASRLKPLAPKPGRVDWPVTLDRDGRWTPADPALAEVAAATKSADPLAALLGYQRHLGWEVGIALQPAPETSVGVIVASAVRLEGLPGLMSGMIRVGAVGGFTNTMGGLTVRTDPVPAAALVTVEPGESSVTVRHAPVRLSVEQLRGQPARRLEGPAALREWLGELPAGGLVQVEATADLTWRALTNCVGPVLQRSAPSALSPMASAP